MQDHYRATELCGTIFHIRQFETAGPDGPATLVVVIVQMPTGLRCGYGGQDLADALHLLQCDAGQQVRLTLDRDCTALCVEAAL